MGKSLIIILRVRQLKLSHSPSIFQKGGILQEISERVFEKKQVRNLKSLIVDGILILNLIYELSNFLQRSGYRLVDILVHEDYPELLIEAIEPGYLFPEISHDIKEKEFYAKVEDHGLMIASDIEEIIKGYETAIGVLHHLEELDLSKLEIDKEEK